MEPMKTDGDSVKEIFETPAVKAVEEEILEIMFNLDHGHCNDSEGKMAIRHLLKVRQRILNSMFVMDDDYKQLLSEFNDALKQAMLDMRQKSIAMHESVTKVQLPNVDTWGKVFMGFNYPKIHPIQTPRARKMWEVLTGSYDYFMPLYEDGIHPFVITKTNKIDSENMMLYLTEEEDNWNEDFDRKMTADMHLVFGVHQLVSHLYFSIFDILWVRDFYTEVKCEVDHYTYKPEDCEDVNWNELDYLD